MGGEGSPGALWSGFAFMTGFTLLFMRASYHSRSKTSRVYHYMTTLITALAALAYLVMALGIGDVWVRFLDWLLTTPMLLADLAFLAGMAAPEVAYLACIDMVMVAAGYAAQMSYKPYQVWPMFAFSMCMFGIIVAALLSYLRKLVREHTGTVEAKAYRFLAVWTLGLWCVYPLLFVLEKADAVDPAVESIVHCILDILAKGIFGVILVGSREALEGESTGESLLAMAVIGIDPLKRRASMTAAHMAAVDFITSDQSQASANQSVGRTADSSSMTKKRTPVPEIHTLGAAQHITGAAAPAEPRRVLQHSKYSDRNIRASAQAQEQRAPPPADADVEAGDTDTEDVDSSRYTTERSGAPSVPLQSTSILMEAILQAAQRDPTVLATLLGQQQAAQPAGMNSRATTPSRRNSNSSDPTTNTDARRRITVESSGPTIDTAAAIRPPLSPSRASSARVPPAVAAPAPNGVAALGQLPPAELAERLQALLSIMSSQTLTGAVAADAVEPSHVGGLTGAIARSNSRRRGSFRE